MKKHDFMYLVEIDTEYNHNSGTYQKAEVVSVDTDEVLSRVYKQFKIDDKRQILRYCIERIYRLFSPNDITQYTIDISAGYYGDEIVSVTWKKFDEFIKCVEDLCKRYSKLSQIEYTLEKEYGYIIPRVKNATAVICEQIYPSTLTDAFSEAAEYQIKTVMHDDITNEYVEQINNGKMIDYDIFCIVDKDYHIIDGFHRFAAHLKTDKLTFINVIRLCDKSTI